MVAGCAGAVTKQECFGTGRQDGRAQERVAFAGLTDGVDQVRGADLFEHVPDRARLGGRQDVGVVAVGGEHEHAAAQSEFEDSASGLQAVEPRHDHIHDHDIGFEAAGHLDSA
jgi:hypothetical protein